ncbi:MAG: hypothetical protein ACTSVY_05485 [Candidatus Helarchaeota archaeon]
MVPRESVAKLFEEFDKADIMKVILGLVEEIQDLELKVFNLEYKLDNLNKD